MFAYVLTLGRLVLAAGFALALAYYCTGSAAASGSSAGHLPLGWMLTLLALAGLAELTDMLDGVAARRFGTVSRLGGLLDPLCDSLCRLTMYYAIALAGWLALAVPLVMTARDLVVAYVRTAVAHAGGGTAARWSGKAKAIVQGLAILVVIVSRGTPLGPGLLVQAIANCAGGAVIAVTLWSLFDYLRSGWPAIMAMKNDGRSPVKTKK